MRVTRWHSFRAFLYFSLLNLGLILFGACLSVNISPGTRSGGMKFWETWQWVFALPYMAAESLGVNMQHWWLLFGVLNPLLYGGGWWLLWRLWKWWCWRHPYREPKPSPPENAAVGAEASKTRFPFLADLKVFALLVVLDFLLMCMAVPIFFLFDWNEANMGHMAEVWMWVFGTLPMITFACGGKDLYGCSILLHFPRLHPSAFGQYRKQTSCRKRSNSAPSSSRIRTSPSSANAVPPSKITKSRWYSPRSSSSTTAAAPAGGTSASRLAIRAYVAAKVAATSRMNGS